jgi:hypothetical protein
MATPTYTLIDSVTVGSGISSVTFSSIDQNFGDLVLVGQIGSSGGLTRFSMRLNSDSGTNYSRVYMQATDSGTINSAASTGANRLDMQGNTYTETALTSLFTAQLINYSSTNKHKIVLIRYNSMTGTFAEGVVALVGRYASTSAVTAIQIYNTDYDFLVGSTLSLYGIAKAL